MINNSKIILKNYILKIFENFDLIISNSSKKKQVNLKKISLYIKKVNIKNHFIDFFQVLSYLMICFFHIKKSIKLNKRVLFTSFIKNKTLAKLIKYYSKRCNEFYIIHRWKSGTLTNFEKCLEQIKKLKFLELKLLKHKLSTRDTVLLEKKIKKLKAYYEGIKNLNSFPGLVINFNEVHQKTIFDECKLLKIPLINVLESVSTNPKKVNIFIILNRHNLKKTNFLLNQISSFINYLKIKKDIYKL